MERLKKIWEGERDFGVKSLGLDGLLIINVEREKDWKESYNQGTGGMKVPL